MLVFDQSYSQELLKNHSKIAQKSSEIIPKSSKNHSKKFRENGQDFYIRRSDAQVFI